MKIGIIQASSQKDKNELIFECAKKAIDENTNTVVNFGIFKDEDVSYSYVETAIQISLLLESGAIDFVISGCSSGQGMMLACNSLPGILCGYIENPSDAYLFGRINDGNVVSLPLGLNFGWAAEINLQSTLDQLFCEPFGTGYPAKDAARKQKDTKLLKEINALTKRNIIDVLPQLDKSLIQKVLQRDVVFDYIMKYGTNPRLQTMLKELRDEK